MKFWNKKCEEMTVKEATIWSIAIGMITAVITWIGTCTDWFETVGEKITGIWNKIFHK